MSIVYGFIKAITRLNEFIGRAAALLIFVLFAVLLLGVFYRYMLNAPTVWTTELTQFVFGIYGLLSGGYVLAHRGHVNVDLLYSALPLRARAGLDIFTSILFFLFTGALVYFGGQIAWESIQNMETSYSSWNPPVYPFKAMIPIAAVLLLVQGLAKLLEDIVIACGYPPITHDQHDASSSDPSHGDDGQHKAPH